MSRVHLAICNRAGHSGGRAGGTRFAHKKQQLATSSKRSTADMDRHAERTAAVVVQPVAVPAPVRHVSVVHAAPLPTAVHSPGVYAPVTVLVWIFAVIFVLLGGPGPSQRTPGSG